MYAVFEFRNTSSYKTWCNRLPQRYPVTSPVAVLTVERPRWSAARPLGRGDSFDADARPPVLSQHSCENLNADDSLFLYLSAGH